jgi:hypothetical protein
LEELRVRTTFWQKCTWARRSGVVRRGDELQGIGLSSILGSPVQGGARRPAAVRVVRQIGRSRFPARFLNFPTPNRAGDPGARVRERTRSFSFASGRYIPRRRDIRKMSQLSYYYSRPAGALSSFSASVSRTESDAVRSFKGLFSFFAKRTHLPISAKSGNHSQRTQVSSCHQES